MDEQRNDQAAEIPAAKEALESSVLKKPEVQENVAVPPLEQPSVSAPPSPSVQVPVSPQPAPVIPDPDPALQIDSQKNVDDLSAEEGDIIEKPWVEKAEKIIDENKDNPYEQEEEQEDLQIDYMKKRFGKEIGKSE